MATRTKYGDRVICGRCDLEIEFIGNRRWHDRGGNTHCLDRETDSYTKLHRPATVRNPKPQGSKSLDAYIWRGILGIPNP